MSKVMMIAAVVLSACGLAFGATVTVGGNQVVLAPNQAGQTADIAIQSDGAGVEIQGADLNPSLDFFNGAYAGPVFEVPGGDITSGIFAGNSTGNNGTGFNTTQLYSLSTTTVSGTVSIPTTAGVLGTVPISTVGVAPGSYFMDPESALVFPSALVGGTIGDHAVAWAPVELIVTPEPASLILLGLGALFLRRRRA